MDCQGAQEEPERRPGGPGRSKRAGGDGSFSLSGGVCVFTMFASGAIFLTPGNVELMNGHNDGVRLILEGSILENNTAFSAGGAIFSR